MARNRFPLFFGLSIGGLIILAFLGLCAGTVFYSPLSVLRAMLHGDSGGGLYAILLHVRIPRVLGAALGGGALAVSGAVIQSVLSNPLASPNVIGINSGAGLFVLLVSAAFPAHITLLPLAAFGGAMLAAVIVLLFSSSNGQSRLGLVLAGFAVSSIFSAGMNAVLIFYPDAYVGAGSFLAGGLGGVTLERLLWPSLYISLCLLSAFLLAHNLNLLQLGQDTALSLGIRVPAWRFLCLAVASGLAGAAVSFAGLIGFVGLIVPHAVRFFTGYDNRALLPACAIWGAAFVLVCDIGARTLFAPYELPVGILMAFAGSPFFLYLIFRNRSTFHDGAS